MKHVRDLARRDPELVWGELLTAAHAWQLFVDELDEQMLRTTCLPWLSTAERTHYGALSDRRLRRDYLAAVALCRWSLSQYASIHPSQWRFTRGAYGKPRLAAPATTRSLKFNLTRTNGLSICLVTRAGDVGVDAEDTSQSIDLPRLCRHFLSRREQQRIARLRAPERRAAFFELWVLHEAYVKGTGKGLGRAAERLRVRLDHVKCPRAVGRWRFSVHHPSATHVAAAAVRPHRDAQSVPVAWLKAVFF